MIVNGVWFDLDWEFFLNYCIIDLQGQFIVVMDIIGGNQGQIFIGLVMNMMWFINYILGNKVEVYIILAGAIIICYFVIDNFYFFIVNVFFVSMEFICKVLVDILCFVFSQDSVIL